MYRAQAATHYAPLNEIRCSKSSTTDLSVYSTVTYGTWSTDTRLPGNPGVTMASKRSCQLVNEHWKLDNKLLETQHCSPADVSNDVDSLRAQISRNTQCASLRYDTRHNRCDTR